MVIHNFFDVLVDLALGVVMGCGSNAWRGIAWRCMCVVLKMMVATSGTTWLELNMQVLFLQLWWANWFTAVAGRCRVGPVGETGDQ